MAGYCKQSLVLIVGLGTRLVMSSEHALLFLELAISTGGGFPCKVIFVFLFWGRDLM